MKGLQAPMRPIKERLSLSEENFLDGFIFSCKDGNITIKRDGLLLEQCRNVCNVECETLHLTKMEMVRLISIMSSSEKKNNYFIWRDATQSTIREVDQSLQNLESVLRWLLPTGYSYRQGDIALYECSSEWQSYFVCRSNLINVSLDTILGSRHFFDPPCLCANGNDGVVAGRLIVMLEEPSLLMHPEHGSLKVAPGIYEVIAAKGKPLPVEYILKESKQLTLPL